MKLRKKLKGKFVGFLNNNFLLKFTNIFLKSFSKISKKFQESLTEVMGKML